MTVAPSRAFKMALIAALTVAISLLFVVTASAHHKAGHGDGGGGGGGGGGGEDPTPTPLDTGWFYYYGLENSTRKVYRVSPDGATNEEVLGAPAEYGDHDTLGRPSEVLHDGSRWYVAPDWDNADIVFPNLGDGTVATEFDAVREGDSVGVRLTDNRAACIAALPDLRGNQWTTDMFATADAAITWVGTQWADNDADPAADCETFVAAGIFRADVIYDAAGAVTGLGTPTLVVEVPYAPDYEPTINGFAWSPDAAYVAYAESLGGAGGPLFVATPGSSLANHTLIADGKYYDVGWSPDQDEATAGLQTTIAYTGWDDTKGRTKGGVWSVQPDGSGRTLLAEAQIAKSSGQSNYVHHRPQWSPAGSHLAYTEAGSGGDLGSPGIRQLRRMAADGSDNVVLVPPGPQYSSILYNLNWTE